MFGSNEIKVVCKQCGRQAAAESFVLDHVYKKMVCPNCIKERYVKEKLHKEVQELKDKNKLAQQTEIRSKPAGWDAEDAYLEKAFKMKAKTQVKTQRIDENRLRCTCPKCEYQFIYNETKKYPYNCPYCSSPFNL